MSRLGRYVYRHRRRVIAAWSLVLALAVAFAVTVPVNRALIARGKGHAVVHAYH